MPRRPCKPAPQPAPSQVRSSIRTWWRAAEVQGDTNQQREEHGPQPSDEGAMVLGMVAARRLRVDACMHACMRSTCDRLCTCCARRSNCLGVGCLRFGFADAQHMPAAREQTQASSNVNDQQQHLRGVSVAPLCLLPSVQRCGTALRSNPAPCRCAVYVQQWQPCWGESCNIHSIVLVLVCEPRVLKVNPACINGVLQAEGTATPLCLYCHTQH